MRTPPWPRMILPAILAALFVASPALPEEAKPDKSKIQKHPAPQEAPSSKAQTQTAPAGKGKPEASPQQAGLHEIQGIVSRTFPDRNAILVQTTTQEHQLFVTPQSVLLRDGKPAGFKMIQPGDRVESCHYNAKGVIQKMTILAGKKPSGPVPPAPPGQ